MSKKIILLKGTKESEIERKDVISYSKSLKTLFESRLGFRFQIGKNHERVVLVPLNWFNVLTEPKEDKECRNMRNVLCEEDNKAANRCIKDSDNNDPGVQSTLSIHSDIPKENTKTEKTKPAESKARATVASKVVEEIDELLKKVIKKP